VCPECQTSDEQREAGWKLVKSLVAEIERRGREGEPTDDVEKALISHVMALRAHLEATDSAADDREGDRAQASRRGSSVGSTRADAPDFDIPKPGRAPEGDAPPIRDTHRVAMTGAFLTGCSLRVRIRDYDALRSTLRGALQRGWETKGITAAGGTYESGWGFSDALPLLVARREGFDLVPRLRDQLRDQDDDFSLTACSVTIDVYDLGVAVLTAWFDVGAPARPEPARLAKMIMQRASLRVEQGSGVSPLVKALQAIADETADEYTRAVQTALEGKIERPWSGGIKATESGRLLWLHPVHVLEAPNPSKRFTRQYAPVFHEAIKVDDGVFAPGINWSALAVSGLPSDGVDSAVKLTQLHWAYYALYMELDRALMGVLNRARVSRSPPPKALTRHADRAFGEYLRVMEARARLDSELSALGGDNLAIWQAISDVQRFDTLVSGVERKVDALRELTQRRATQAAAERDRRMSRWLGWLTAFTVVTATFAVVAYLYGSTPYAEGHETFRTLALIAAALALVIVVVGAYRRIDSRDSP